MSSNPSSERPETSGERRHDGPPSESSSQGGRADKPSVPRDSTSAAPGDATPDVSPPPTPITQQIGRAAVIVLAVLFGVFAVANGQHVDFSWVFGETAVLLDADGERVAGGVRLIVLMIASLAIGMIVGGAVAWQRARSKRRSTAKDARRGSA